MSRQKAATTTRTELDELTAFDGALSVASPNGQPRYQLADPLPMAA